MEQFWLWMVTYGHTWVCSGKGFKNNVNSLFPTSQTTKVQILSKWNKANQSTRVVQRLSSVLSYPRMKKTEPHVRRNTTWFGSERGQENLSPVSFTLPATAAMIRREEGVSTLWPKWSTRLTQETTTVQWKRVGRSFLGEEAHCSQVRETCWFF